MSWKLALTWLVAVVTTTFLTWQIVNVADSSVSPEPFTAAPPETTTTTVVEATTTTTTPTTTSSVAVTSTSTSSSPASTGNNSSTTVAASWSVRTINTSGGTVVVRYRPGEVELQAATPAPGFEAEVDDAGPLRVRVEFKAEDVEIEVEVRWIDGALSVEIDDD